MLHSSDGIDACGTGSPLGFNSPLPSTATWRVAHPHTPTLQLPSGSRPNAHLLAGHAAAPRPIQVIPQAREPLVGHGHSSVCPMCTCVWSSQSVSQTVSRVVGTCPGRLLASKAKCQSGGRELSLKLRPGTAMGVPMLGAAARLRGWFDSIRRIGWFKKWLAF